jgi:hypothetical protein
MISVIYLLGFIMCFAYLSARLSKTIIRVQTTARLVEAMFFSMFWFVTVPYTCITGTFFKSQREFDEVLYNRFVEEEIEKVLSGLKKSEIENKDEVVRLLRKEIGTMQEMLNDMIYFSHAVSKEELAGLIAYKYCRKNDYKGKKSETPEQFVLDNVDNLLNLTKTINKDGIDCGSVKTTCCDEHTIFKDLLGFHTLDSGLTFLGGISENIRPFFFIIYYNGKELRAFVPRHNFYNKETRRPFGVDEGADYEFFSSLKRDEVERRKMYGDYKRKIDPARTLREIEEQVNYVPRRGGLPSHGWDDINFEA